MRKCLEANNKIYQLFDMSAYFCVVFHHQVASGVLEDVWV